jgi:hypothetical protein
MTTMTRRHWVGGLSIFATAKLFGASEFWNKRDASTWSSDEVLQLATRSPWAKTSRVLPKPGRDRGSLQPTGPDIGAGGRSGNQKLGEIPVLPVAEVTVVWESAQPLLDALKSSFPSDFANHYVIGVNDLPKEELGRKVNLESMTANLQVPGKDSADAGAIQQTREVVLFAFSKELLPLTPSDREVVFMLDTNQYSIRTRFDLKEMMYRGKLAV